MPILATTTSTHREPIPAGNYPATCYQMIHIGTVTETINGDTKQLNKVRIGWELPTELKVFNEEKGEQPLIISEEYTLSMHEKSNLRKTLASWRGKDFSDDEAKGFDVTKLLGKACMINVIHKTSKTGNIYEKIGSVSSLPKGMTVPPQMNDTILLTYDDFDKKVFEALPDFIQDKVKSSAEFMAMMHPDTVNIKNDSEDDLPF